MTIWRKVGTLFRASADEPVEKLVDANALRIMGQEIRDTEQAMIHARHELANLMAEGKQLARSNAQLETVIGKREDQARQALEKGAEALALELAGRIAIDENLLREQRRNSEHLARQETTLREHLRGAAGTLQHYRRELSLARANRNAEQVLRQMGSRTAGLQSHMGDLAQSMKRIKSNQTRFTDVDDVLRELQVDESGDDLEQKLRSAGIATGVHDAEAVLARLVKS